MGDVVINTHTCIIENGRFIDVTTKSGKVAFGVCICN